MTSIYSSNEPSYRIIAEKKPHPLTLLAAFITGVILYGGVVALLGLILSLVVPLTFWQAVVVITVASMVVRLFAPTPKRERNRGR